MFPLTLKLKKLKNASTSLKYFCLCCYVIRWPTYV